MEKGFSVFSGYFAFCFFRFLKKRFKYNQLVIISRGDKMKRKLPKKIKSHKNVFKEDIGNTFLKLDIMTARKNRLTTTIGTTLAAGSIGALSLFLSPEAAKYVVGVALATGAGIGFKIESPRVKKATNLFKQGLKRSVESNEKLKLFLQKHKYVYVDRKGRVRGTNRERVGIGKVRFGRLRIATKEILA